MNEPAKRPRVALGGHTDSMGPVLLVGLHAYELDERTALSWVNTLTNYLWHKMAFSTPPTNALLGDDDG